MAFPSSPSNGQQAVVNGITFNYDSTKTAWVRTANNFSTTTLTVGSLVSGGNITANTGYFFLGNGSQLTGLPTPNLIYSGSSNVFVTASYVNVAVNGSNITAFSSTTASVLYTTASTSNVTGALVVTGGIGVGGNVYHGQRSGFVWGANNVSSVYQVFNNSTNSLDTVFG